MTRIDDLQPAATVNALDPAAITAIEQIVAKHLDDTFPAASVSVIHRGEVWLNRAWGWIDPETRQIPVTPATRFDLASVTKLFTATAFLTFVSEGRVRLDDPLVTIIPEFGASGPRPLDGGQDPHSKAMLPIPDDAAGVMVDPARVTFWHLLTHTSGLAPWRDVYNAAGEPPTPPDTEDPVPREVRWQRGLAALCRYPFVGEPDNIVRYSDLGLMLLGEATARLGGKPGRLDDVIAERVIQPLGLTTVTFNPVRNGVDPRLIAPTEDDPVWRKRRPWGEVHDENACGLGGVAGHAGLFGTARDVAAFGQAWLRRDPRLGIDPELMDNAVRYHVDAGAVNRGLGWMLTTAETGWAGEAFAGKAYGHTGFTGTSLLVDASRELVVACLTNSVYPGRLRPGQYEFARALHTALADAADALR